MDTEIDPSQRLVVQGVRIGMKYLLVYQGLVLCQLSLSRP